MKFEKEFILKAMGYQPIEGGWIKPFGYSLFSISLDENEESLILREWFMSNCFDNPKTLCWKSNEFKLKI